MTSNKLYNRLRNQKKLFLGSWFALSIFAYLLLTYAEVSWILKIISDHQYLDWRNIVYSFTISAALVVPFFWVWTVKNNFNRSFYCSTIFYLFLAYYSNQLVSLGNPLLLEHEFFILGVFASLTLPIIILEEENKARNRS